MTRSVHFSGIGGTGMVAAARLAVEAGWEVRGSDNPLYEPTASMVASLNVPIATGYAAANLDWNPDVVVVGNALSRGNVEVEAVLERKCQYVSFPEWIKDALLRKRRPVAVCGTHGKTTTTALTAYLMDRAGLDNGFMIGGQPLDFEHSARLGAEGAPFAIEGDEYDSAFFDKRAKFFHYLPEAAIVTSIEFDHGDIYPDLAAIHLAFQRMLRQIPKSGRLFVCADDAGAMSLCDHAFCPVESYGFSEAADWRADLGDYKDGLAPLTIWRGGTIWAETRVPLAGRHNIRNVLAATAAAAFMGADATSIAEALPVFRSVRRRMEIFLEAEGTVFVDDFAHHPTAIRETIAAARTRWPERRLLVAFEPRSNTTVTNRFQDDLVEAFSGADRLWLGPIYRAERIPENERLDRSALAERLGDWATYVDDIDTLADAIQKETTPDCLLLILSNGAFGGIYEKLRCVFRR